jgi:hypothetical protein
LLNSPQGKDLPLEVENVSSDDEIGAGYHENLRFLFPSTGSRSLSIKLTNETQRLLDSKKYISLLDSPKRQILQGISTGPIRFNSELARRIYWYLLSLRDRDYRFEIVPTDLIEICGNELKRFMCSLQAYYDSPNPVICKSKLLLGITDINFAAYLKRVRYKSFINSFLLTQWEEPEWWKDTPWFSIRDIGDIFNFNYWFFWEEEPVADYKSGFIPLDNISAHKELFQDHLRKMLPRKDYIQPVEELEILLTSSSSACITTSGGNSKVWKEKERSNYFSDKPLFGKRCLIPVSPANMRDSIKL